MEGKGEKEKKAQRKKGWGARTPKLPTPASQRKPFGFRFGSIGAAKVKKSGQEKVSKGVPEQRAGPLPPPDEQEEEREHEVEKKEEKENQQEDGQEQVGGKEPEDGNIPENRKGLNTAREPEILKQLVGSFFPPEVETRERNEKKEDEKKEKKEKDEFDEEESDEYDDNEPSVDLLAWDAGDTQEVLDLMETALGRVEEGEEDSYRVLQEINTVIQV